MKPRRIHLLNRLWTDLEPLVVVALFVLALSQCTGVETAPAFFNR